MMLSLFPWKLLLSQAVCGASVPWFHRGLAYPGSIGGFGHPCPRGQDCSWSLLTCRPTPRAPPRGPLHSLWHPEFPDSSAQLCGLLGNILSLAPWTMAAHRVGNGTGLRVDTAWGQARFSVASVSPDSQLLWCHCLGVGTLT